MSLVAFLLTLLFTVPAWATGATCALTGTCTVTGGTPSCTADSCSGADLDDKWNFGDGETEEWQIEVLNCTAGTFTLTVAGETTSPINCENTYSVSGVGVAMVIMEELEALSDINRGDVWVERALTSNDRFNVFWIGSKACTDAYTVSTFTGDFTNITGGIS